MTQITVAPGAGLTGACTVPGDKSISHRAVMFGSIAEGDTVIRNFLDGGDCRSTIAVMRGLGVSIDVIAPTELVVHGRGLEGLHVCVGGSAPSDGVQEGVDSCWIVELSDLWETGSLD